MELNSSLPPSEIPSENPLVRFYLACYSQTPGSLIFSAFLVPSLGLLLPLCAFTLCHCLRRWRRDRSGPGGWRPSHSDCFTYHAATVQLLSICGNVIKVCGVHTGEPDTIQAGGMFFSMGWYGQILFYILTCLDRYLAVVRPVTYLNLRGDRGSRVRNGALGGTWALCLLGTGLVVLEEFIFLDLCVLVLSVAVVTHCNVMVLRVLRRPGPAGRGLGREKRRAFRTIMAILTMLTLRFAWGLFWIVTYLSQRGEMSMCAVLTLDEWVNFPSDLLLPLLYLQRAGTLRCCRRKGKDTGKPESERSSSGVNTDNGAQSTDRKSEMND